MIAISGFDLRITTRSSVNKIGNSDVAVQEYHTATIHAVRTKMTERFSFSARPSRAYVADTIALIMFFTTTGIINERFIACMSWDDVMRARLLGAALMVPVGRPYGIWRDWIVTHAKPTRTSQIMWDSLALLSFQVPIYGAIIALSGATGGGLLRGMMGAAVMMIVLGRPYGAFLNFIRRFFGLPPGGKKPMSLKN
ncbi:hypothetical protein C241_16148 [Bradyrhizobium lupini HPC(L)]|uniref:L-alanine exporter AlaE n=2 Tax=Rhizobium lupini TaxID=136996 RepID=A0ABN0HJR6_RHILU|nr:hypothetical protein C241_16148 [Bradyrhizobium lupini HPC(L)]